MKLPQYILDVLNIYESHGFEAFVVGGCVRDALLQRECHDYDIITNALPKQTMELFNQSNMRLLTIGLAHGTLTLLYQNQALEITTYRKEGAYKDHRRPHSIIFTNDIYEDLKRRDFTINALAYNTKKGMLDLFNGIQDIQTRIIRCVGDPDTRMAEDALRILRALRFAAQLSFTIEDSTWQAILHHASDIRYISNERIQAEFNKYLLSNSPNALTTLKDAGVLDIILPEMQALYDHKQNSPWHCYDIFTHTEIALNHSAGYDLEKKLALVFHDIGKPLCETIDEKGIAHYHGHAKFSMEIAKNRLQSLHYPKDTIKRVITLIAYHDYYLQPKRKILRRFLAKLDNDFPLAFDILDIQWADNHAKHQDCKDTLITNIKAIKDMLKEMQQEQDLIQRKDLAINGYDLIALGYQGAAIGKALEKLYQIVVDDPSQNQRAHLFSLLTSPLFED